MVVHRNLRRWLQDEWEDKNKKKIDLTGWEDYTAPNCPQQNNTFDCGMFVCKFADAIGRNLGEHISSSGVAPLNHGTELTVCVVLRYKYRAFYSEGHAPFPAPRDIRAGEM